MTIDQGALVEGYIEGRVGNGTYVSDAFSEGLSRRGSIVAANATSGLA